MRILNFWSATHISCARHPCARILIEIARERSIPARSGCATPGRPESRYWRGSGSAGASASAASGRGRTQRSTSWSQRSNRGAFSSGVTKRSKPESHSDAVMIGQSSTVDGGVGIDQWRARDDSSAATRKPIERPQGRYLASLRIRQRRLSDLRASTRRSRGPSSDSRISPYVYQLELDPSAIELICLCDCSGTQVESRPRP